MIATDRSTPAVVATARATSIPLGVWWLLLLAWCAASQPRRLVEGPQVVPSAWTAVLAPDWAWTPPLAATAESAGWSQWPGWVFMAAATAVIAAMARRVGEAFPIEFAMLAAGVLVLTLEPRDLLPAACLLPLLAGGREEFDRGRGRWSRGARWASRVVALLATLEFGLVWGLLLLSRALPRRSADAGRPPQRQTGRGEWVVAGVVFAGLAALGAWERGFVPALLRPVSWMWYRPDPQVFPSLSPVFVEGKAGFVGMQAGLAALLLAAWGRRWREPRDWGRDDWLLLAASAIGLGCSRYLWLCVFAALASTSRNPAASAPGAARRRSRLALAGGWLLSVVALWWNWPLHSQVLAVGGLPPRLVDPSGWGATGNVLLTNLDQSGDWRPARGARGPRLLVDDRWDLFGGMYAEYAAVCRDIGDVRHESYLRSDSRWGGYLSALRAWSPTLLAIDSSDLDRIRSVSLSPHWRILAIDGRRTMYGWLDDRQGDRQAVRAMRTLAQLEWPQVESVDPQVIAAADAADARRVAAVLCAIRLPYAALRLIRSDVGREAEELRTWCYLELAHRAWRYAGTASLLDQSRAAWRLRQESVRRRLSTRDRERIARGLAALGLAALARELSMSGATVAGNGGDHPPPAGPATAREALTGVERQVCEALLRGDAAAAGSLVGELPASEERYYRALLGAREQGPAEAYGALRGAVEAADFPARLRGEAAFYLACLAIEAGDAAQAVKWLRQSLRGEPPSEWNPLSMFYLGQFGVRSR